MRRRGRLSEPGSFGAPVSCPDAEGICRRTHVIIMTKPWTLKHLTIVHGFWPESDLVGGRGMMLCKSTSQGEQNDPNFSFIAPSVEE